MNMALKWAALVASALLACVLSLFYGAADLSIAQVGQCVFQGCKNTTDELIFWEIRLPRSENYAQRFLRFRC